MQPVFCASDRLDPTGCEGHAAGRDTDRAIPAVGALGHGAGAKTREILVDSWPPGGSNGKEAMPIAQDDYDEAYENDENQNNENEMVSGVQDQTGFTNDGPVDWEDAVDEDWIKQKNENDEMPDDKTDIEE